MNSINEGSASHKISSKRDCTAIRIITGLSFQRLYLSGLSRIWLDCQQSKSAELKRLHTMLTLCSKLLNDQKVYPSDSEYD